MKIFLGCLILMVSALATAGAAKKDYQMQDTFGKYLASLRDYKATVRQPNPRYADELLQELQKHLKTVSRWIDGSIDKPAMEEALRFFHGRYRGKGWIYRGTAGEVYDGKPASFTKKRSIAEGFAKAAARSGKEFFVIKRKAPPSSLDFSKLLKEYASGRHYRAEEAEVVAPNTLISANNVTVYTV